MRPLGPTRPYLHFLARPLPVLHEHTRPPLTSHPIVPGRLRQMQARSDDPRRVPGLNSSCRPRTRSASPPTPRSLPPTVNCTCARIRASGVLRRRPERPVVKTSWTVARSNGCAAPGSAYPARVVSSCSLIPLMRQLVGASHETAQVEKEREFLVTASGVQPLSEQTDR
jgi:hypothetical protein